MFSTIYISFSFFTSDHQTLSWYERACYCLFLLLTYLLSNTNSISLGIMNGHQLNNIKSSFTYQKLNYVFIFHTHRAKSVWPWMDCKKWNRWTVRTKTKQKQKHKSVRRLAWGDAMRRSIIIWSNVKKSTPTWSKNV